MLQALQEPENWPPEENRITSYPVAPGATFQEIVTEFEPPNAAIPAVCCATAGENWQTEPEG